MKLALLTDAWKPQVNGVVTTLVELIRHLQPAGWQVSVIHPGLFRTRPCPGYAGIDLAVSPGRALAALLEELNPDAIHLATEGPIGWAGRRHCLRRGLAFTTAFHTKFPEIAHAAVKVPVSWGYALMRHFHRPSSGVMVPTPSVLRMLEQRGFSHLREWTHGVDTELFAFSPAPRLFEPLGMLPRPISLFVGRVSYEKNIQAFLELKVPGSKIVCGVGPVEADLKRRYPDVHWVGLLERPTLARLYAAADVFVFPSFSDTFGLVMLEAMATGTPVAAYPADGPLEVLQRRHANGARPLGGVMHPDLEQAWRAALYVPRTEARQRALDFRWESAAQRFAAGLVPARGAPAGANATWNPAALPDDQALDRT
jgi:glycosyltransferase involved in cell wall biosynthesis